MFERVSRLFGGRKRTPPAPPPEAPFEYLTVHGEAVADEMRRAAKRAGVVPVLMGTREEFAEAVALIKKSPDDFDAITQAGQELNVEEWIRERREAEPDYYEIDETEDGTVEAIAAFSPARDVLTGEFRPEVFIGLIPVEAPWLVPAYLKSGGWNECPEPHVHLAFSAAGMNATAPESPLSRATSSSLLLLVHPQPPLMPANWLVSSSSIALTLCFKGSRPLGTFAQRSSIVRTGISGGIESTRGVTGQTPPDCRPRRRSSSSSVRGQSSRSSLERDRSARSRPPVWQVAQ